MAARAILVSVYIYATTTHTQDFKDIDGDFKIKRSTVPLDNPRAARPSVLISLMAWSMILSHLWDLDSTTATAICVLGIYVGLRFCIKEGRKNDQISFYWYNVSAVVTTHQALESRLIAIN